MIGLQGRTCAFVVLKEREERKEIKKKKKLRLSYLALTDWEGGVIVWFF